MWRYTPTFSSAFIGIIFFAIRLEPIDEGTTIEHVAIYFTDERALDEDMADLRQTLKAMWHEVFVEDIFVVEGMQRGRASPAFSGGVFSPMMDGATHAFHHWVAEQMMDRSAESEITRAVLDAGTVPRAVSA